MTEGQTRSADPSAPEAEGFWGAIDRLAAEKGFTSSGLARAAGLDPTALNPSKRHAPDGRVRLPRMETLLELLRTVGVSWREFSFYLDDSAGRGQKRGLVEPARASTAGRIKVVEFSRLGPAELFDRAHLPIPHLWAEVSSPFADTGPHDYAIRLDTAVYEPSFRRGSLLLVSPASMIHKGDRVLCCAPAPFIAIADQNGKTGWTVRLFVSGEAVSIPTGSAYAVHRVTAVTL
ncbi:MAG: helix-turn-helix transcriptional regulator [Acetobacter aceti]|uniref:Peptidase S24 n=1 Tax=Acetobacter aceti TaxID=435 RepID=A0A1U9KCD5_ACEAC|nr:helix-turn-helix transcriptional regulator [Acetobacter aceti]AQS83422.1 peptidase S24 [Acetobacter aceti]